MHGLLESCDFHAKSNRRRTVRARNSPHATGAICPGADQPIGAIPDKLLDPVRSSDLHPGKRVKHRVRLVGPATPRRMSGEHIVLERFAGFSPVPPELIPLLCGPRPGPSLSFSQGLPSMLYRWPRTLATNASAWPPQPSRGWKTGQSLPRPQSSTSGQGLQHLQQIGLSPRA